MYKCILRYCLFTILSEIIKFSTKYFILSKVCNDEGGKVKVKVSHSLIAVGAVGVRVPLYLGHSW